MKMVQDNPMFQSSSNFAFCQARCRTSSESVLYDKEYRSVHKFCYGTKGPSKDADLNMNPAKYEALYASREIGPMVKAPISKKKAIRNDEAVLPVFLEVAFDSNELELMAVNGDIQANNPMLFGLLGGEQFSGDTSSGSYPLPSPYLLFIPLVFFIVSYGLTLWTRPHNKSKSE